MSERVGRRWLRQAAGFMCIAVLCGSLSACGKKDQGNEALEPVKGRYVETEIPLPEQLEDWSVRRIFSVENEVHLLAVRQKDGETEFSEWADLGEGFQDVTGDWLSSLRLHCEDWPEAELLRAGDGTEYLRAAYTEPGGEEYRSHLWRDDGGNAREITPGKWETFNEEWGGFEYILSMAALDNGTLAAVSYTGIDLLSGEDGSLLGSEAADTVYYLADAVTDGTNLYLCSEDVSGALIEKRENGSGADPAGLVFPQSGSGSLSLCVMKDGTLIVAGTDGIFRCKAGETDWEKLLDAGDTGFALADRWCIGMTALEDGRFYALFRQSEDKVILCQYEYDPDAVIEVTQRLTLYTVYESYLLKNAAAMYHRAHPETVIAIQYVYDAYYYDETDYNSVYQELNTLLTGDNAPDILVLDHLKMDSYVEKGLLLDLNDVVSPMEETGELLAGITGSYVREDGSRYAVPLQFGFDMAVGREIAVENMSSLKSLAAFLSSQDDSYLGERTTAEIVDLFYPYFCNEVVDGKELNREVLGEDLEYLKLIADNCPMIVSRSGQERGYNMWDLASGAKLAFEQARGFNDCMFPIAIMDYVGGECTAFENCFIPICQTGICTKSQYTDTAKDFLRFALSGTIQDTDYYSGFPVNVTSLELQAAADRTDLTAYTTIETDGGMQEFTIGVYSEETADKLVELCKALDHPAGEDDMIRSVLIEALEGYLNGSQSKEDTIQKIEDGLKMYLAE